MVDIARDDDVVELAGPPRFAIGERVASRSVVRNDGTYTGKAIGELLISKGEVGYVRSVGTFLQQFYIYAVEFVDRGVQVGMRAKELCTLDHLPPEVLAQLRERLGEDRVAELERMR
jgi:nitrogen fixation protein NifZ